MNRSGPSSFCTAATSSEGVPGTAAASCRSPYASLACEMASLGMRRRGCMGPLVRDGWLDAKAAAAYLGFASAHPLHKLTARREIAFSQDATGGKCWFRRSDLDAYRLQGRIEARDGRA